MVKEMKDKGDKMINTFYSRIVYKDDSADTPEKAKDDVFYKQMLANKGHNTFDEDAGDNQPNLATAVNLEFKAIVEKQTGDDLKYRQRGLK